MKEILKKLAPQNFNDSLCVFLIGVIVALWILQGCAKISLQEEVTGALIVSWTLLIQYYYRKKTGETGK